MNSESRFSGNESNTPAEQIGGIVSGVTSGQSPNVAPVSSVAMTDFDDPAKKRRERIEKMKPKLQSEIARDSVATRKERNGQLFV